MVIFMSSWYMLGDYNSMVMLVCLVMVTIVHCPMVVGHHCRASWPWLGVHWHPWRWPSHLGDTSLSVVMAVVVCCCGLFFVFVQHSRMILLSPLSSVVANARQQHLSLSFVRARSGEERAVDLPGISYDNAKRPSLISIAPTCCHVLPPHSWRSWVQFCSCMLSWSSLCGLMTMNNRGCHVDVGDLVPGLSVIMEMVGSGYPGWVAVVVEVLCPESSRITLNACACACSFSGSNWGGEGWVGMCLQAVKPGVVG